MRYIVAILVLAVMATAGLGYSGLGNADGTRAVLAGASVESVVLINVDGDEVRGFRPADNPQRFKVFMSKVGAGRVKAVFTAVEIDGERNIKILEKEVVLTSGMNTADFAVKLPNDFPVGSYKVDVYVNDKLAKTVSYSVE